MELDLDYFLRRSIRNESGCWIWQGAKINSGYGNMGVMGVTITSHRASYIHHKGPILEGMVVTHSCDNRLCVFPGHLIAKTQSDNIKEMFEKGRQGEGKMAGQQHPASTLTNEEVWQIKDLYKCGLFLNREIGEMYNLKANTVVMIGNGTRRQNVPNPYRRA